MQASTIDWTEGGFRALAESSPFGIYHTDAEGNCTYSNPAWHKISGLSAEQSLGDGWSRVIHPEDRQRVFSDWQKSKNLGQDFSSTYRIELPGSAVRHVRVESRPLVVNGIHAGGHVGTVIDITERVRAEEKTAAASALLTAVLASLPAGIRVYDSASALVIENDLARSMGDQALRSGEEPKSTVLAGSPSVAEEVLSDGRVIELRTAAMPGGGYVVVLSDVSQTKRALQAALANRFLDSIIENIPMPVFVKDARDLSYVRVNRAVEEVTGLSRADIVGKYDRDIFPADAAVGTCLRDREVLAGGDGSEAERLLETRGKGLRLMLSRRVVIRDELKQPVFLLCMSQDVTEKRARRNEILNLNVALEKRTQEAEAGNRAKSAFLATISHEMRTPMNGMLGLLELLSLTRLDADQRQTVASIRASSKSLLAVVDAVLDLSSIEAGILEIRPVPGSVAEMLHSLEEEFSSDCRQKGLALTIRADPAISARVQADFARLRQILSNFLSNALKFTPRGSVELSAELSGRIEGSESLKFSVSDTGIGISPDDQRQLFAAFRVGSDRDGRVAGGMGLGLVICRKLAELMGGSVEIVSEPGRGTVITLTLAVLVCGSDTPKESPRQAPAGGDRGMMPSNTSADTAQSDQQGIWALVVDDHPTNRALMLRQMSVLGYAAQSAENGLQALEKWRSRRFDIIVTDCEMPEMDGFELARCIRSIEAGGVHKRVPIIACSAHVLPGIAEKCAAAGMDEFLSKPTSMAAMRSALARCLPLPFASPLAAAQPNVPAALPLDIAFLEATWGTDPAVTRETLECFRRVNDADAAMLRSGVAAHDVAKIRHATHRMLGASKMIGAKDFSTACESLHEADAATDWEVVLARVEEFERQWIRLNEYLDTVG